MSFYDYSVTDTNGNKIKREQIVTHFPVKDSYFDKKRMMVETAYYYYATRFIYNKK